jgi:hypothetical protein
MTLAEAIETTRIGQVAESYRRAHGYCHDPPVSRPAPHHLGVDLIGGGQMPLPGDVSLVHNGVLFLDERPEFRRHVLEVLCQLIETGVTRRRAREPSQRRRTHATGRMGDARAAPHERVSACPHAPPPCRLAERFAVV